MSHATRIASLIVACFAAAALSACGGGGGGGNSSTPSSPGTGVSPPPPPPISPPPPPPPPATAACPSLQSGVDLFPEANAASACTQGAVPLTESYAAGADHQFDLYRPTNLAGPFATVIWIHGGGWQSGSRANVEQARRLVCRGYAVASIDYRLSDVAPFPAQIHDVKAAIRYLRANASRLNLDPNRFATFGSSAGGHLSALAATSSGVAAMEDLAMGNPTVSSAVQAGVDWYGPIDFSQMDTQLLAQSCPPGSATHSSAASPESKLVGCTVAEASCAPSVRAANPVTYLGANSPPLLILHGTTDCTVPTAQSDILKRAQDDAGRCAIRRNVVGAGHGGNEWFSAPVQDAVAAFLDNVLR
ncbi:MAG: alpha/beta hydrolase [Hyphomonadaceae bacterium]|nr:alpha/beta hydrolase [Hyphomonadaceae bacterium]